jgi:SHS2 domain-containing protein
MDHTADLGAYFYGPTVERLFANAAVALTRIMLGRVPRREDRVLPVEIEAMDQPALLASFLSELIYYFSAHGLAAVRVDLRRLTETRLQADVHAAQIDFQRERPAHDVKAATHHQLEIARHGDGYRARVIFDL